MKKGIIILCLVLSLSMSTSIYAACAEGQEVSGKNGHVYCVSKTPVLNWFSAVTWCQAQGRSLATVEQICDIDDTQKWDGNTGSGKCLNSIGMFNGQFETSAWTITTYGEGSAFYVGLKGGSVYMTLRHYTINNLAVCW